MREPQLKSLKRELRRVDSEKPQLVKTAGYLQRIDRVNLRGYDVREYADVTGSSVKSVCENSDFRDVWDDIVEVMGVVAPVETREVTGVDGQVRFEALASGSQRELKVVYYQDGSLSVTARWAMSAGASMAMVVVDETYDL